ncbi:hypothetical protein BG004_005751 [Podila humilis]|nr:hypothetical protein BG004_005751 [Podila humilis]
MLASLSFYKRAIALLVILVTVVSTIHSAPVPIFEPKAKILSSKITLTQLRKALAGNCPAETVGDAIACPDALPFINVAIKKYKLKTKGQKAAYLANMIYEGGSLQYNHNLNVKSQGTRSIMPAVSLRLFVDANPAVQKLWPGYPTGVVDDTIVDVLIANKLDFEPGAWWAISGPNCRVSATQLTGSQTSFETWQRECINGGADTAPARAAIYKTVYAAI